MYRIPSLLFLLFLSLSYLQGQAPTTPPAEVTPAPEAEKPDPELVALRALLERVGFTVKTLEREEQIDRTVAVVHFLTSRHARLRTQAFTLLILKSFEGYWRVTVLLPLDQRHDLDDETFQRLEAEMRQGLRLSRYVRDILDPEENAQADADERGVTIVASHMISENDPKAFVAFLMNYEFEMEKLLTIGSSEGGFLLTASEVKELPLKWARDNISERLRMRTMRGFSSADLKAGQPAADDPISLASYPLDPWTLNRLEKAEYWPSIDADLALLPLAHLPGYQALSLYSAWDGEPAPEVEAALRKLAYDPVKGTAQDAWALYHLARYLINTMPEDNFEPQMIEALDVLRLASRLGNEYAMFHYIRLLERTKGDLVGAEEHWEQRTRWEALLHQYSPHEIDAAADVEQAYRQADLSPLPLPIAASAEELAEIKLAVEEMNHARRARGWKTFEIIHELPATEMVEGPLAVETKDPAEAGSEAGS